MTTLMNTTARPERTARFAGGPRRLLLAALLAGVAGLAIPGNSAQPASTPGVQASGLSALKAGQFDEARSAFRQMLAEANRAEDTQRQAQAWFYLGLADQQAAEGADADRRVRLLRSSMAGYRRALSFRPETAGVLNNLARVQAALGQTNAALESLGKALELEDPRRGLYAQNYADLLLAAGRWRDACQYYALIAGEQPGNRTARSRLIEVCLEHDPDLLVWYLWELAERGQVSQVEQAVLEILGRGVWTAPLKEELLGMVAHCLSRKSETRREFLASESATRLGRLRADATIGRGAQEVLWLFEGSTNTTDYVWWQGKIEPGLEAPRGEWPFEAFLGLIRSLAERAASERNPQLQESFLLLAVGMKAGAPDPEALLRIANLYSESRDTNRLDSLMRRYEVDALRGKGDAYTASQKERIYRYHMALGVIYSQLGRFSSPGRIDSAEFQLSRALATADDLSATAERDGRPAVVVPAQLVELLAQGYAKAGRSDEADRVRLDRADTYLRQNEREAAARVIQPLRDEPHQDRLDDSNRLRLLKTEEALRQTPAPIASPTSTADIRVRVDAEAWNVAGEKGRRWLEPKERAAVESALNQWVARTAAASDNETKGTLRALDPASLPEEVQEIQVQGRRGTVLLRRGTNLVRVPFTVPTTAGSKAANQRWIRK